MGKHAYVSAPESLQDMLQAIRYTFCGWFMVIAVLVAVIALPILRSPRHSTWPIWSVHLARMFKSIDCFRSGLRLTGVMLRTYATMVLRSSWP